MSGNNTAKEKDSVLGIIILFLLVFIVFKNRVWVYTALSISVLSALSVTVTHIFHVIWTWFTGLLAKVNAWIILSLVFILILIPTAVFKAVSGKKGLILSSKDQLSLYHKRDHTFSKGDFDNLW